MNAWTRMRGRFGGSAPVEASAGKDLLKWVAAAFALVATATAEYDLARAIGMNEWVAAAVPGALDAYVVRALRAHREVLTAVLAMVAVNAASHLVTAGVLKVEWPLITAVSAIAPLVLWRVHALGTPGQWRARKLWGLSKEEHADVLASTEPEHTEHERAPDNPEPPGTREHPEVCYCGADVWGDIGAHQRAPGHPAAHAASTDQARVHAQTAAWGDDWMDVHDAVHTASTPPVPVHAPYTDHVHVEQTSTPALRLIKGTSTEPEHTSTPVCPDCEHAEHSGGLCGDGFCACAHGLDGTRTADDWNLEHVSKGVLTPEDTEHMDRARELFHTVGGLPPFRALKEGQPSMGTPRATRLRAALKIEAEGTN